MRAAGFPYTIDDGIPIPPPNHWESPGRPRKVDWSVLKVGQSCLVPDRSTARSAYSYALTHPGVVFRCHKRGFNEDERGYRVWRVS